MTGLDDPRLAEISGLADKAVGPGFSDLEREQWRTLTGELLVVLQKINPAGSERRKHLRAITGLPVQVVSPVELKGLLTSSIGGGGLAIPIADPPPDGTSLDLSIGVLQRQAPIRARARVVWRRLSPNGEIGAAFTDIGVRDQDLLEAVVMKALLGSHFAGY